MVRRTSKRWSSSSLIASSRSSAFRNKSNIAGRAGGPRTPMTKSRVRIVLEMIKFEHSVFALPFALVGALLAARAGGGLPTGRQLLWIVFASGSARSAAMTVNRIADREYDRRNPRTANRAIPAGELSVGFAWVFTA